MAHLDARPERGILDLAEVAHVHAALQPRAGAQVGERADADLLGQGGALQHRALDSAAVADDGVAHDGVGAEHAAAADGWCGPAGACWAARRVSGPSVTPRLDVGGGRVEQGHAGQHPVRR